MGRVTNEKLFTGAKYFRQTVVFNGISIPREKSNVYFSGDFC